MDHFDQNLDEYNLKKQQACTNSISNVFLWQICFEFSLCLDVTASV